MSAATLDIVGGGILGLMLAYDLTGRGFRVRVWERAAELGGLMGRVRLSELGDIEVDRYYHAILSSDHRLQQLIDQLGLRSSLHAVTTRMGFYHEGRLLPMSTPLDFLRFPVLNPIDRGRLAFTILAARRVRDWRALEQQPVLEWLTRLGGANTVEHVWKPLLRAKFDGDFQSVPATYIWSRLVRMTDTRDRGAREQMCYLTGGYIQLINALAAAVQQRGGQIHLQTPVEQVRVEDGRSVGLLVNGQPVDSDGVLVTLQTPIARRLLPAQAGAVETQWGQLEEYLGIVSLLLALRRSLSPYYTLNINDANIPFTGVIETTNLIDPALVGGYHLVYLPKYVAPGSPYARMDDETLTRSFLDDLRRMFPDLQASDIAALRIGRERYVEPLHPVGATDRIPPIRSAIDGLYLVNSSQIYPQLTNGEAAVAHATQAAALVAQQVTRQKALLIAA